MIRSIAISVILLAGSGLWCVALAAEYHVNLDGSGDFTIIQEAIDASQDGDVIVVHPGTYYENVQFDGKNITLRSVDPEDPGCVESTIIDGMQAGSVVTFAGTEDETCQLLGFTITNGKNGYGGGICGSWRWNAPHARVTIEHCVITGNTAADALGPSGGGLMWCDGTISNCTISNNSARWGAGLAECYDGSLQSCRIVSNTSNYRGAGVFRFRGTIQDCDISDNYASVGAGGLRECEGELINCTISRNKSENYFNGGGGLSESNLSIYGCTITQNSAERGAGLYKCKGIISDSSITHNRSATSGGGIHEFEGELIRCVISGNSAGRAAGGGICLFDGDLQWCVISDNSACDGGGLSYFEGSISNCVIKGNYASTSGGGMDNCVASISDSLILSNSANGYGAGAVYRFEGDITNCLIAGNSAEQTGGGIGRCNGNLVNCTLVGNSARDDCGGISSGSGQVKNCVIWGNSASEDSQLDSNLYMDLIHCCIQDWTGGGEGNISDNPLFAAGPLGNYYLSQTAAGQELDSSCIDAGSAPSEDLGLDKLTTRTDGAHDEGIVDIGYHYPAYDVIIEASLNDNEFVPGETVEASVSVENRACEAVVDVYVGLILPDDSVVCLGPGWADFGVFPLLTRVFLDVGFGVGPLEVLHLPLPKDAIPGAYAFAGALSDAATGAFISSSIAHFEIRANSGPTRARYTEGFSR